MPAGNALGCPRWVMLRSNSRNSFLGVCVVSQSDGVLAVNSGEAFTHDGTNKSTIPIHHRFTKMKIARHSYEVYHILRKFTVEAKVLQISGARLKNVGKAERRRSRGTLNQFHFLLIRPRGRKDFASRGVGGERCGWAVSGVEFNLQ